MILLGVVIPIYKIIPEIMIISLPTIKNTKEIELKISKKPPTENSNTPTNINKPFNFTNFSSNSTEFFANIIADSIRITFKKIIYDNINSSYSESTMLIILPIKEG